MDGKETLDLWGELPLIMRPKLRYWLPAAAVEEKDLREEIRTISNRGFGGIEVCSLIVSGASSLKNLFISEDGWGTERWNEVIRIINDEAGKIGMSMDITNGPGWPISSPVIDSAEDPAVLHELTYGVMNLESGCHYVGELPSRRVVHEEGKEQLVHVLAYEESRKGILREDSYLDLRAFVTEQEERRILDYHFPQTSGGCWKVFAFYQQPAVQKTNGGLNYVIDHLSVEGARACEIYWDKVFSKNQYDAMESFFCDSLEYRVALDWTPDFLRVFQKRRGYSLLPFLPFIGMDHLFPLCDIPGYRTLDGVISDMVNRDYCEMLTRLYCENHLAVLEKMARKYGKTLRYQVAYNKAFEAERCGLYVTIPENEALGRASMDYQKIMAASAHLGRKKRYSFECAAEFGNSYGQDHEDLFWWIKRSLMAGMNAQVLHGGSYSGGYSGRLSENGRIPGTQWPGFEGFLKTVSNNWNRTLSVEDTRNCMDTITRLNSVFRKQAKVDCAILRESYLNDGEGSEFCLYPDQGALSNQGFSYEFVSEALLQLDVCKVKDGVLDPDGVGYKCLIIPETDTMSIALLHTINRLAREGLPVIWIGTRPQHSKFYGEWNTCIKREEWERLFKQVWDNPLITHVEHMEMVPDRLASLQIQPEVSLCGEMDLITAARYDQETGNKYFILYAYNRVICSPEEPNPDELSCSAIFKKGTTKGSYHRPGIGSLKRIEVWLKGKGDIYLCDPWSGKTERKNFIFDESKNSMVGKVDIQEDEMVIFLMRPTLSLKKNPEYKIIRKEQVKIHTLELQSFEPDSENEVSFLRSHLQKEKIVLKLDKLVPWRVLRPDLEHFSGVGTYYGEICLGNPKDKNGSGEKKFILSLGCVSDTFSVWVNDKRADFPDQVMKRADITGFLRPGRNTVKIVVTSNLYNRLFTENTFGNKVILPYLPRDYGIWEDKGKNVELIVYQQDPS